MREILFRGKRIDNGEWVEGCLLKVSLNGKTAHLIFGDNFIFINNDVKALSHALIDPTTVGQYTGLKDKNGKRIFEGDVVRFGNRIGYVTYGDGCFCIHYAKSINCPAIDIVMCEFDVEVIGNIHDNPELLNGGDAG